MSRRASRYNKRRTNVPFHANTHRHNQRNHNPDTLPFQHNDNPSNRNSHQNRRNQHQTITPPSTPSAAAGIRRYQDNLHPAVFTAYRGIQASSARLKSELEDLIQRINLVAPSPEHMDWDTTPGILVYIRRSQDQRDSSHTMTLPEGWEVPKVTVPEGMFPVILCGANPYLPGGGLGLHWQVAVSRGTSEGNGGDTGVQAQFGGEAPQNQSQVQNQNQNQNQNQGFGPGTTNYHATVEQSLQQPQPQQQPMFQQLQSQAQPQPQSTCQQTQHPFNPYLQTPMPTSIPHHINFPLYDQHQIAEVASALMVNEDEYEDEDEDMGLRRPRWSDRLSM